MEVLDHQIFRYCYGAGAGQGSWVLRLMIVASIVGSGWSMFALLPLLARARTRRWATSLLATLLATATVVFTLKKLVARHRPSFRLSGVHALFGSPTDYSFPSGHAAGAFSTAAFVSILAMRRARTEPERARVLVALSACLLSLAAVIAYSRIYLGAHFPMDVLAGATVGSLVGSLGAWLHLSSIATSKSAELAPEDRIDAD